MEPDNITSKYTQLKKELFGQRLGCHVFFLGTLMFCISSICIFANLMYLDGLGEDITSSVYVNAGLPILGLLLPLFGGVFIVIIGSIIGFIKVLRSKIKN